LDQPRHNARNTILAQETIICFKHFHRVTVI